MRIEYSNKYIDAVCNSRIKLPARSSSSPQSKSDYEVHKGGYGYQYQIRQIKHSLLPLYAFTFSSSSFSPPQTQTNTERCGMRAAMKDTFLNGLQSVISYQLSLV